MNTDTDTSKTTPAYVKLLRSTKGATSEELRVAMNRVYGPTMYQLKPIAKRLGFKAVAAKIEGDLTRYRFEPVAKKTSAKKPGAAAKTTKPATKKAA